MSEFFGKFPELDVSLFQVTTPLFFLKDECEFDASCKNADGVLHTCVWRGHLHFTFLFLFLSRCVSNLLFDYLHYTPNTPPTHSTRRGTRTRTALSHAQRRPRWTTAQTSLPSRRSSTPSSRRSRSACVKAAPLHFGGLQWKRRRGVFDSVQDVDEEQVRKKEKGKREKENTIYVSSFIFSGVHVPSKQTFSSFLSQK